MPLLIDTHTHLYDRCFADDLETVLTDAASRGVATIITVSETLADARRNLELCSRFPSLRAAAGLYPANADEEKAERMEAFIRRHRADLAAIGETGLDFWLARQDAEKERQRIVFARFIELGRQLDLPLNIHSRSAGRHAIAMLLERNARRVQLHAFDGKLSAALPAVEAGYFFSVPPSIVRSRQKQKLVKGLPLSCLLLETDSPVLGPEPGTRNAPANINCPGGYCRHQEPAHCRGGGSRSCQHHPPLRRNHNRPGSAMTAHIVILAAVFSGALLLIVSLLSLIL